MVRCYLKRKRKKATLLDFWRYDDSALSNCKADNAIRILYWVVLMMIDPIIETSDAPIMAFMNPARRVLDTF